MLILREYFISHSTDIYSALTICQICTREEKADTNATLREHVSIPVVHTDSQARWHILKRDRDIMPRQGSLLAQEMRRGTIEQVASELEKKHPCRETI